MLSFKKTLAFCSILLLFFCFSSCSNDDENETETNAWKLKNEQALEEIKSNPQYTAIEAPSKNGTIYMKQLVAGSGKKIYYTSLVNVYYKGQTIDGNVFDKREFEDGKPFGCAISSDVATTDYSTVIEGWSVALQHMVEGDKYEVWIPQELAYGSTEKSDDLPAYSTLIFEIEVISIEKQ